MRTLLTTLLHGIGLPGVLRARRVRAREVCVLMFHRVSDEPDPLWPPLPVATFRRLMAELAANAQVVPLERVGVEGDYPDKPLVALSFDDGYLDFWHHAVPILSEFGLPAQHNICPGLVDEGAIPWTQVVGAYLRHNPGRAIDLPGGGSHRIGSEPDERELLGLAARLMAIADDRREEWVAGLAGGLPADALPRLMGWEEIRLCAAAGIQIGSHGMNHRNLAELRDRNMLAVEIEGSRRRIAEQTGCAPTVFSFPNGQYSAESMRMVDAAGYETVLLCEDMVSVLPPGGFGDAPRVLPRINISRRDWKEEYLRLLGLHQLVRSAFGGKPHVFMPQAVVGAA